MGDITITMLGDFDIVTESRSALVNIGNSPKSLLLLKYLILNKGKAVQMSTLIDVLWPDMESSVNPENALKTMVSRVRANLREAGTIFENCILSKRGAYQWNDELPCTVDVFQFEELCARVQNVDNLDETSRETYLQILNLYRADLSYASLEEEWVVSRSLFLRHLYFQTVYRFVDMLTQTDDNEMIILACRIALEIDAFDEKLNLAMMKALKRSGQTNAALMLYRHLTGAYYKQLGVEPSKMVTDYYKQLIQTDYSSGGVFNDIRSDLVGEGEGNGALVCDYAIFKYIYQLQKRYIARDKNKMYLALLTVEPAGTEPVSEIVVDQAMQELMKIVAGCLRKGDTVTRYGGSQYALLLPMAGGEGGNVIISRVRKLFRKACGHMGLGLSFQLDVLEEN